MLIYKIFCAAMVVVTLSLVVEYMSPKWAGVFSGFPTGTAIILYFYGLEYGIEFAGHSAIYNMVGLVAMQMFLFGYYLGGVLRARYEILASVAGGLFAYLTTIFILSIFSFNIFWAIIIPISSFFIFHFLFRKIPDIRVDKRRKTTWNVIALRATFATLTISFITEIAKLIGPDWAGLLSAFPSTLFPLMLIIHWSYGQQFVHAMIKHVPSGLGGLLAYSVVLYLSYPSAGLYPGMLLALATALLYLIAFPVIIYARDRLIAASDN